MSAPVSERERAVTSFLTGWSREGFLQAWADEVSALGIAPVSLLQAVAVPAAHAGTLAWWPRADLDKLKLTGLGVPPPSAAASEACGGPQQTLTYLLQAGADAQANAAVLLCASLSARVERARTRYPREAWPPFAAAQTLLAWTRAQQDYRWPADCMATLPAHASEDGLVIGSLLQLVRFLATEHARVLHRYAPVQLTGREVSLRPRQSLVTFSQLAPAAANAEPEVLALSVPAPAHSLVAPRDPARRRDPRWNALTRAELEALIWSKPQRQVAREFGVSEATVAKRCKLLEIAKPERGFWRRSTAPAAAG